MRPIVAAIHGIMTRQTVASWVDRFDAWVFAHGHLFPGGDPHVIKKEYVALPLPSFNVFFKNWFLARGLAAEIELLVGKSEPQPPVCFVSHSNGTDIALKTIKMLAKRGIKTEAAIFVGSVLRADVRSNGVARLMGEGSINRAYAYCSRRDEALGIARVFPWCAYGHLGITGWKYGVAELPDESFLDSDRPDLVSRRFDRYGHGTYFEKEFVEGTFGQFCRDLGLTADNTESADGAGTKQQTSNTEHRTLNVERGSER